MFTSTERFTQCRVSVVLGVVFVALFVWMLFTPPVPAERNIAVGVTSIYVALVFLAAAANLRAYLLTMIRSVTVTLIPRGSGWMLAALGIGYLLFGFYSIWLGVSANAV